MGFTLELTSPERGTSVLVYILGAYGKTGDAQDAERLLNLLKWMNVSKRVVAVRRMLDTDTPSDDDDTIFDTCAGYWWKSFVTKGTTRTVWENILDIAQYSFNDSDESI